jgi:hypothetical protein
MTHLSPILRASCAAAACLSATSAQAAVNLITFEEPGITAMGNSPFSLVPVGARLSDQFLGTLGALFSSGAGYVAVVDHGYPQNTPSPPNIIGGTTPSGGLDYFAPITVSFFDPGNTANMATTDHVRVLGEGIAIGGTVTMSAYDRFGALLGSVSDADDQTGQVGAELELNIAGIHYVTFSGSTGTVGFDNFEFNTVRPVSAGVPEPAAWSLMIAGFGLLGASLRRRRCAAAAA